MMAALVARGVRPDTYATLTGAAPTIVDANCAIIADEMPLTERRSIGGCQCFFMWEFRIHVLGLPDNRRTKALLAVVCLLVPHILAALLTRRCLSYTLVRVRLSKKVWRLPQRPSRTTSLKF